MSRCIRSSPKCAASERQRARQRGFTAIELLMSVVLMGLAVVATSGMFLASKQHMILQQREIETTQAARAAIDMIVRDLRLGGACLPVTGDFISLDGHNNVDADDITTRTGLTRPDLSCIRSTVPNGQSVTGNQPAVPMMSTEGFSAGMRAYIRGTDGTGEYFTVSSVPSATQLNKSTTLSKNYPATSGVYAIDERKFFIAWVSGTRGLQPELQLKIGAGTPSPFAVGIEKMKIRYQLRRNCSPCDIVDVPANNAEWAVVDEVLVEVTARSELPDTKGNYYRRIVSVGVKPRNLLPP